MKKYFVLFLALIVSLKGYAANKEVNNIQKHVFSIEDITDENVEPLLDKNVSLDYNDNYTSGLDLTDPDTKEKTNVSSCNEFYSKKQKGFYPATTFDITMQSFFINTCHPLLFFKNAKPSLNTNFTPPYFNADSLNILPSNMGNIYQISRHPPCDDFTNLAECFEKTVDEYSFDKVEIKEREIGINTDVESAGYEILAKGDINNDGWEDLLVFYY